MAHVDAKSLIDNLFGSSSAPAIKKAPDHAGRSTADKEDFKEILERTRAAVKSRDTETDTDAQPLDAEALSNEEFAKLLEGIQSYINAGNSAESLPTGLAEEGQSVSEILAEAYPELAQLVESYSKIAAGPNDLPSENITPYASVSLPSETASLEAVDAGTGAGTVAVPQTPKEPLSAARLAANDAVQSKQTYTSLPEVKTEAGTEVGTEAVHTSNTPARTAASVDDTVPEAKPETVAETARVAETATVAKPETVAETATPTHTAEADTKEAPEESVQNSTAAGNSLSEGSNYQAQTSSNTAATTSGGASAAATTVLNTGASTGPNTSGSANADTPGAILQNSGKGSGSEGQNTGNQTSGNQTGNGGHSAQSHTAQAASIAAASGNGSGGSGQGFILTPEALAGWETSHSTTFTGGFGSIGEGLSSLKNGPTLLSDTLLGGKPGRGLSQAAANQVNLAVSKAVQNGTTDFTIKLNPHELGKVTVKLSFNQDGSVKAEILAQRPETLEVLQKDKGGLEKAIEAGGTKVSDGGISLSLEQEDRGSAGKSFAEAMLEERLAEIRSKNSDADGTSPQDASVLTNDSDDLSLDEILPYVTAETGLDIHV